MASSNTPATELPLFSLHAVLFPGGLLSFKVLEAHCVERVDDFLRSPSVVK